MTKIRKSSRTSLVGKHSLPSKCFRGAAGSVPCFSLLLNPTETLATQATVNITVKTAQARRKMAGKRNRLGRVYEPGKAISSRGGSPGAQHCRYGISIWFISPIKIRVLERVLF